MKQIKGNRPMKTSLKARAESSLPGQQTRGTGFLMPTQKKETGPSRKRGQEKALWPREAEMEDEVEEKVVAMGGQSKVCQADTDNSQKPSTEDLEDLVWRSPYPTKGLEGRKDSLE